MADKRLIHTKLLLSDDFNSLTFRQQSGWFRLLLVADDQGRFVAKPTIVRSQLFPDTDISLEDIEEDLQAWQARGMIHVYSIGDRDYLQVMHWWKYQALQWAKPSDFPAPEGWVDRVRVQRGKGDYKENWDHPGGWDSAPSDSPEPDPLPDNPPSDLPSDPPSPLPSEQDRPEYVYDKVNDKANDREQQTRARARGSPAAAAANPLGAMATLYENNIGPLTGMLRDELGALCDDGVTVEIFQYAVQQACEHNARNLAYVKAITDRVLKQGWESVRASPNGKRTSRAADMMRRTDEAAEQFLAEDADG